MLIPPLRCKRVVLPGFGLAAVAFVLPAMSRDDADDEPLKEARLILEMNATDGDVGIQGFADGEPWDRLLIGGPDGKKLFDAKLSRNLGDLGGTELFFESHEPELADLPLDDFLALFPEGTYTFIAIGTDGTKQVGEAHFTHAIPAGPVIQSPPDGATLDPSNVVIDWDPVVDPPGIVIVEYEVIVEQDSPHRVLDVHLPASATSFQVPEEFLESGADYEFEVLAIEIGGNQTITSGSFATL